MKKKILGVFVSLLVVVMLALSMSTAYAKKPYEVSGTIDSSSELIPPPKLAGINTFKYYATTSTWDGDISGDTVGTQTWIIHPGNHLNIPDVEIFFEEATVDGKIGTLTIRMSLVVSMNPDFPSHGNWRIIDATGGLEGLHGRGTWGAGWYEGTIHFDP